MTLNYGLLTKAINNMEKKKVEQKKPSVDASAFIREVDGKYNTIDKYFLTDPNELLASGEEMLNNADPETLDIPLGAHEMLDKL